MVLVFSLQPNDINATSCSRACQQFEDFVVEDHFQEISDFSELFWLLSAKGLKSGQKGMKTNLMNDINDDFNKKYPDCDVMAQSLAFKGGDTGNGDVTDTVTVYTYCLDSEGIGCGFDVDVGRRLMGGPGTGEDLFKPLHTLFFSESPVRIQMLKFGYRLVGRDENEFDEHECDEYGVIEVLPKIVGKKFDFKNRFQIEVLASSGNRLRRRGDGFVQGHLTSVKITNLESGKYIWNMDVDGRGPELKVKEVSEEQEKLFVEFQEKLKANFECEWLANLKYNPFLGRIGRSVEDLPMLTTVFNPNGTDGKFTVTTELREATRGKLHFDLAIKSVVSSDEDPDRNLSIYQDEYLHF
eukprot:GHVS01023381.1.p1 GENE.GHVS01023381.1~~GHVS01023381.1.p1  ORF type:complete len:374 (+),score=40.79 GHVS01023381.1:63-1124(+)